MSSMHPTKMMSKEEKEAYYKQKKEKERELFKWGTEIDRMEVLKPKFAHKKPIKRDDSDNEEDSEE